MRRLSDYGGQPVILYFYPADDTPGCTKEACSFREDYSAYQKPGVTILGVSPDSVNSHIKFKEKYQLPFPLLADDGHHVCNAYGVWRLKKLMGRECNTSDPPRHNEVISKVKNGGWYAQRS
jgi:peroxiredoxin Q/BCP